ncbi:MAG: hypothetical protein KGL43_28310, partial [Burkholderiales bacterium]|nr:hypothetical protein [Burkholderiales bacterium]
PAEAPRQGRALAPRPAAGGTDPIGDRVVELLQTHRLVTVVGEHEPSRRRTAEASSRRVLHTSHDSVFWLDAIDLAKGSPSPGCLVRSDDEPHAGRGHPGWPLLQRLGNQDAVVVLFNCQRAPEVANRFIDAALEGTPRVRVLATAQRALGRSGEQVVTVPKAAEVEFARLRGFGR